MIAIGKVSSYPGMSFSHQVMIRAFVGENNLATNARMKYNEKYALHHSTYPA
jgi:HKD family nuclease